MMTMRTRNVFCNEWPYAVAAIELSQMTDCQ